MKVELKNVCFYEGMSEETNCFRATVYVDGKRRGEVSNQGQGGPNEYRFDTSDLDAYAKGLPARATEYGTFAVEFDDIVDDLFMAWMNKREHDRLTKGRTTFRLKADGPGMYRTIKAPFSAEMKAKVVAKYGNQVEYFLNERKEA